MEIRLAYVDPATFEIPDGMTAVGFIGAGDALAYDAERRPHRIADGVAELLDPAEVNRGLVQAVDEAGLRVWPGGWTHALPQAFGLNRRTTQRDRIERSGLNPAILKALGIAAGSHDADGLGVLMSALATYVERHAQGLGVPDDLDDAAEAAANALSLMRDVRRGRTSKAESE